MAKSVQIEKLDENFNHILIHTGQHFDKNLSDVFFEELKIRKPDFNLKIGSVGKEHFYQTTEFESPKKIIKSGLILFLQN